MEHSRTFSELTRAYALFLMGLGGLFIALMSLIATLERLFDLFKPANVVEKRILIKKKLYPMFGIIERLKAAGNQGDMIGFTTSEYRRLEKVSRVRQ